MAELLRLEQGGSPSSFRLEGELDVSNASAVGERLLGELRRFGALELDTTELDFVGVDGIRMLMELGQEAERLGTKITVVNCSSMLRRLMAVVVPAGIPGVEVIQKSS